MNPRMDLHPRWSGPSALGRLLGRCTGRLLVVPVAFFVVPGRLLGRLLGVFLAVEAAFLPASAGWGGNHTALVALAFATNEAPRAAHLSLSVTLFHPLLISIIDCVFPLSCIAAPALTRRSIFRVVALRFTNTHADR